MKKGFILTAIATVLFVLLIDAAFQYSRSSSAYSQRVSEMIVSEKIGYTFDDITEDITNITGLSITQQESDLIFRDSFPASGITDRLSRYEDFMRTYYLTPDLEATFLTPDEHEMSLGSLSSEIIVKPFNMSYAYTDFGKTDLLIQIPYSEFAAVQQVWYNISVGTGNFSENVSDIKWTPDPKDCVPGTLGCIRFYMKVNDLGGNEYIAPFNVFDATQRAGHLNLNFVNESCWMEMWIGESVGEQYLLNLRIHDCHLNSTIGFNFNTSSFWIDFPTKLRVRDVNYNTSKKDSINVITTKMMR